MAERCEQRVLVGKRSRPVPIEGEQALRLIDGMNDGAGHDGGAKRMQLILEGCDDAEVSPAAADSPEELGLVILAGLQDLAIGSDNFDGPQIVEGEAIFAHEPAQTATKGQTSNPGAGDHPTGYR